MNTSGGSKGTTNVHSSDLVSVVITCFNYERFVAEAIESALAQTYHSVEVIVVDDGSTDGSLEVIRRFSNEHPNVVVLQRPNGGPGAATAAGVRASSGQIICLLDADDRFHPTKIQRVVERFARSPDAVQVAHQRRILRADGTVRSARPVRLTEGDVVPLLLRWGRYSWMVTSCLSYRRDPLLRILDRVEHHPVQSVDLHTTVAAAFLGPVAALDEPLTDYRVHGSNMHQAPTNLRRWREATVEVVNEWAEATGHPGRLRSKDENELVLLHPSTGWAKLRALARTVPESIALRRSPIDACLTMLTRLSLAAHRTTGERMLLEGPVEVVRSTARRRPGDGGAGRH